MRAGRSPCFLFFVPVVFFGHPQVSNQAKKKNFAHVQVKYQSIGRLLVREAFFFLLLFYVFSSMADYYYGRARNAAQQVRDNAAVNWIATQLNADPARLQFPVAALSVILGGALYQGYGVEAQGVDADKKKSAQAVGVIFVVVGWLAVAHALKSTGYGKVKGRGVASAAALVALGVGLYRFHLDRTRNKMDEADYQKQIKVLNTFTTILYAAIAITVVPRGSPSSKKALIGGLLILAAKGLGFTGVSQWEREHGICSGLGTPLFVTAWALLVSAVHQNTGLI